MEPIVTVISLNYTIVYCNTVTAVTLSRGNDRLTSETARHEGSDTMSTPRATGSPAQGRGTVGVAAAICAPSTSPPVAFAPTLPYSDTSSQQRRKARTQNNTRAAPAVARPSSNLSLFLPISLLGEVVPCQSLPPPSLPVSWPDSPVSGAGARNPRLGSLIDLTADRAATDESPILALTPPRAD